MNKKLGAPAWDWSAYNEENAKSCVYAVEGRFAAYLNWG